MNFLNSQSTLIQGVRQSSDEVEALQTDIMRFMAILGLCLMAIFSIVQSLPYQQEVKPPGLERQDLMQNELLQLQQRHQKLLEQVQDSAERLQAAENKIANLRQANLQLNDQLQHSQSDFEQSQRQLKSAQQQLQDLQSQLQKQHQRLETMQKAIDKEQQSLDEIRSEVNKEKQQLQKSQQRYTQVIDKIEKAAPVIAKKPQQKHQAEQQNVTTESQPEPNYPTEINKAEKIGFSLRFQSDAALLQLLAAQKIKVLVLMGPATWSFSGGANHWQLLKTQKPKRYYQMAKSTVPDTLQRIVTSKLSANASTQMVWAVTLPSRIESDFNALMLGKKGGDLVIDAQGKVSLEQ